MYTVRYEQRVIAKDIPDLPKSARILIQRAIDSRLATAPLDYGKPLRRSLNGYRRLRIADYRVVYRVDEDAKTVYVVAIKHRKEVYD